MDGYLIGELLFEGVTVHTPWMPRPSNSGVFAVDVMGISGLTMTVDIETKKADASDDAGNITTVGSISGVSATGVSASALLEDFDDLPVRDLHGRDTVHGLDLVPDPGAVVDAVRRARREPLSRSQWEP